jgi:hypothetical protein
MSPTELESSIAVKRAAAAPDLKPRGRCIADIIVNIFFYFGSAFNLLDVTSKTRHSIHNV